MYQALYRKYRPAKFDDIVGQDTIVQTLKNAIANNKLTHAYLFSGPRGTGKTSTAKILAKTINCQNLNGFEPCNKCDSCIQINNKQSTDIIEIDAASNNGVDEIRELKSKVNLVPSNSKYKVYIIDEVHMLSTGAFNALLKTLEEPPSHILFILATTEAYKIPATILSRCQRFDFKKISVNKIIENLKKIVVQENIDIEEDALKEIAILSQGGMRDSISLLDQVISYCPNNITCQDVHDINGTIGNEEMSNIIKLILNNNITNLLKKFDELDDKGKNLIKLIEELIYYLRNLLVFKIAPDYFEKTEQQNYLELSSDINQELLLSYIHQFSEAIYEMKNSDNEKITLELHLIKMLNLTQNERKNVEKIDETAKKNLEKLKIDEKEAKKSFSVESTQNQKNAENKGKIINSSNKMVKIEENKLEEIKKIRINNTLCIFNRKQLLEYKEKINTVSTCLIDENCSQWASLILDGELKAAGKGYMIFVYKDEPMEYLFNHNWQAIEAIIKKVYIEDIKVVATNIDKWNEIKREFNSKSKIYEWQEEPEYYCELEKGMVETQKNKIESMFEDIIEYSE